MPVLDTSFQLQGWNCILKDPLTLEKRISNRCRITSPIGIEVWEKDNKAPPPGGK